MVVVTRSAQKRQYPCNSPVKKTSRRNVITTRTTSMATRTTTTTTTLTPAITPKKARRNLMDSFNDAAGENDDRGFNGKSVEENKEYLPVFEHQLTPPPTPNHDPESESEIICDVISSPEPSPIKCNPITEAKRLLSIGAVDGIVGREAEIQDLTNYLENCLETQESSTIFISGPPGTGKTLTVQSIITKLRKKFKIVNLFYNSMDFRRGHTIYSRIADDLGLKDRTKFRDKLIESIEKFITKSKNMVILTIDEIDRLDKDLVNALLDWPKARKSKLILIGIANTITSSSLTKVTTCTFEENSVKKIRFRPYTKDQIVNIIQSRLQYLSSTCEIISKPALQFCALKVSSYSGDARKALDIVRQAIELAEREKCFSNPFNGLKITADDGDNQGSPRKIARMLPQFSPRRSPRKKLNFDSLSNGPLVENRHIMNILNSVFGNKLFSQENNTELTIHQQLILCCILCYGKEKQTKEITILPTLYGLFNKSCTYTGISSNQLSSPDFLCICQILESLGLVKIKQGKKMHLTKITLSVNEDEVAQRISEKSLIVNLMKNFSKFL